MKRFMVVYWYYGRKDRELLATNVRFFDSLAQARITVQVTNDTGDRAQLYMLHGDGPEGYYVYCNE